MMRVHCELGPIIQLLLDDFSRRLRHQTQRVTGEINQRLAVFAEWKMKFFAEMAQRILGIEFLCEIFVSGKGNGHKSAANVQRSTPNVQRRIQKSAAICHALNAQLSTINCFEAAVA